MIAPMKKVYLVLLGRDKEDGLLALRKLGVVHLEETEASRASGVDTAQILDEVSRAMNIVPKPKGEAPLRLEPDEAVSLAKKILQNDQRLKEIYSELGDVEREIERAEPWGNAEPAELEWLRMKGIDIGLYSCESRLLKKIDPEVEYVLLSGDKRLARLAVIARGKEAPALPEGFVEFSLSGGSLRALKDRKRALESEISGIESSAKAAGADYPSLKRAESALLQKLAFERASASFEGEGSLSGVKGYVPSKSVPDLSRLASERGWALLLDEPQAYDLTPTKVENGRIIGTIKPIFDFLGIVPGYSEYEISGWFLLFFPLFTAMIFGDGGYGLLMLLAWALLASKSLRAGERLSASLRLFLLIGLLTTAWGAVTGTWFSISASRLPDFLKALTVWPLSSANPAASKNIQVFCFLLGAIQLSIARLKNVVKEAPNPRFIAQLGSLALIVGMLFVVLYLVVDSKRFPMPGYVVWLIVGGFSANIIFGSYEGNLLKSFADGLKNIIPTFLSSVGVFADIVSYIRLWALGLAGSSLAAIINTMGNGLLKASLIAVGGVLILVFGHALNMILSVLSVVVHAIRLNILEFSCNHLGMQWSGIAYDPFRVTYKEKETA